MEKDAYFDRISGWGSALAWVGFTCPKAGCIFLKRGSSYVNQTPGKKIPKYIQLDVDRLGTGC